METGDAKPEHSVSELMDVVDETQPEESSIGDDMLGLGTSTLGAAIQNTNQKLFNPLAQLMESDSDSDSDSGLDKQPPKPAATPDTAVAVPKLRLESSSLFGAAAKAPKSTPSALPQRNDVSLDLDTTESASVSNLETDFAARRQNIVARLKARGALTSHSSDESSDGSDEELTGNASTTEDPELSAADPPKKPSARDAEKQTKSKPQRAASKAALLKMHQESARLVRETHVHVDPLEFTKRLQLSDFYTRFDSSRTTKSVREQRRQNALRNTQKLRFPGDNSDDGDLEILGPEQQMLASSTQNAHLFACLKKKRQGKEAGDRLAGILKYGSQPMHVSDSVPANLKTDGPLALRSLNSALLEAVHKQDLGRKRKDKKRSDGDSLEAQEDVAADGDDETMEDEDDDEDDDVEESDSEDVVQPRLGSRNVVLSDDDDDGDDGDGKNGNLAEAIKPIEPRKPTEDPQTKAKFLGLFKMPAKKPAAVLQEPVTKERSATPDDSQTPGMQDLSFIFPSSHDQQSSTQDSLLLTPSIRMQPETQMTQPGTQPTQMLQQSLDPLGFLNSSVLDMMDSQMSVGVPVLADSSPTQPTQPTQPMQPTQPTQPTMDDTEGTQNSQLPSLVQQALQLELSDDSDSGAPTHPHPTKEPKNHSTPSPDESPSPQPQRRGRLLHRRHQPAASPTPRLKPKKSRLEKSEFLEDEAEVGSGSDSDGMPSETPRHRKFNWAQTGPVNDSDSDSENAFHELDSDEEAEQLLADPLINNAAMSDTEQAEQAVRELHRVRAMEDDEKAIQELAKDIATGNLRNRRRAHNLLEDDEDFNDRQERQERMEERARLQRKLRAREIHDQNLAAIARNPETAAFAHAAFMRNPSQSTGPRPTPSQPNSNDDDDLLNDEMLDLEEEIDELSVAAAVQQLTRPRMRTVSDDDEDEEDDGTGVRLADGSGYASRAQSSQASSSDLSAMAGDGLDAPIAVESMIVRRRTLNSKSPMVPSGPGSLLKRPGGSLLQSPTAKRYSFAKK